MFHSLLRGSLAAALALVLLVGAAGCDSVQPALADAALTEDAPAPVESSVVLPGPIQGATYFAPGCVYRYTIDPNGETGTWSVGAGSSVVASGSFSNGILWADIVFANVQRTAVMWNYTNVVSKLVWNGDPSPPC